MRLSEMTEREKFYGVKGEKEENEKKKKRFNKQCTNGISV